MKTKLTITHNEAAARLEINPEHKHAVAHIEQDFGQKIRYIIKTYATEDAARACVHNGDKGTFPVHIFCGQAYARLTDDGWMLDCEMAAADSGENFVA